MDSMKRREFLDMIWGITVAAALPGCAKAERRAGKLRRNRPNIIFIMADDMGYGDLGCYGQKRIKTPNIDKLAEEGTRFTQCYAGSTVCAPSRSVLMTGQHTGHTRVRGNKGRVGGVGPEGRVPLKSEDFTVAELLKAGGYVTGITGKWGLGEPGTSGIPNRQGFDEWLGYLNQARAHSYYPPYIWKNEEKFVLEGNQNGRREQYTHDLMTDFALDFLRRHKSRPFFLYLPYTVPHAKYEIPSTDPYTDEPWSQDAKVHAAMITRLDGDVARIMSLLEESGIDENTIVFFCSDNGAARRWEGVFDSSGPLRGRKRDMYEGGIRTPMIVRWPGRVPAGKVNEEAVWYFADVVPTFAELAGLRPPDSIDGISVVPAILGKKQRTDDRFLYWEFYEGGFKQAVRRRNYKAVRPGQDKPLELYDLAKDPAETTNIAAQNPRIVAEFEDYLKTARTDSENWPTKN